MTSAKTAESVERFLSEARRSTGLSDFGPDSFKDGLLRFVEALDSTPDVAPAARAQADAAIARRLTNRLQIEAYYAAHPEVEAQEVAAVTSITGLPRTGTTALANILSMDDGFRSLRSWEQNQPTPPPVLETEETDPRRVAAIAMRDRAAKERPDLEAMHLFDVDTTEEDVEILGLEFKSQQLALPIFAYHAAWRTTDMTGAFAYHRRVMKMLQSRRPPNRWLFKAPAHCFHTGAIVKAYPNARFIMTHRDPANSIPSACSFISAITPHLRGEAEMKRFGPHHAEHLRIGLERVIAARKVIGEDRFFDVHHREFVRDPFGVIERIYDFLGVPLRPQARARMEAWHEENRAGAKGSHHYTPEQFGLSVPQLRSDFDFYIKRFGIAVE